MTQIHYKQILIVPLISEDQEKSGEITLSPLMIFK